MALKEKNSLIKNLIAFSAVYLFLFAAVNSTISIQSVLNQNGGLGNLSSTVAFIFQLITCIVLPQFIVDLIGYKWTLVISEIAYTVYVSSNIYPKYFTMLPGA